MRTPRPATNAEVRNRAKERHNMESSQQTMRLHIDERWTAQDMINSFSCFDELYNLRLMLQYEYEEWLNWREFYHELEMFPPFRSRFRKLLFRQRGNLPFLNQSPMPLTEQQLSELPGLIFPHERLFVRRVKYGSEGIKDLVGIGAIVGHVKDFVLEIIRIRIDKEKRTLENEERRLKNQQLRIENARKYVELAEKMGYPKTVVRQMVKLVDDRQGLLIDLVDERKLKDVKLLNRTKRI